MSAAYPFPERKENGAGQVPQPSPCCWRVIGASVIGASHLKHDLPCQDYQASRLLPCGDRQALLIALADGAGSAENADLGAQLAVDAALHSLENSLRTCEPSSVDFEVSMRLAFDSAQQVLIDQAEGDVISVRSLATTLTCVAAVDGFITVGQLGDGSVIVRTDEDELVAVTKPQRWEYAN